MHVLKRLGLTAALVAGLASASTGANAASLSGQIAMLYPLANGTYVLGFNSSVPVCSSAGSIRYVFITADQNGLSAAGAKNIIATALLAFSTDRSVSVVYDDSTSACYVNSMTVQ